MYVLSTMYEYNDTDDLFEDYFFSNIKRSRIVILYQTCVACKAWVTNLQVLQEWQKIPPEDKASL